MAILPEHRLQSAGVQWLRRWIPPPGMVWSVDWPWRNQGGVVDGSILKSRGVSADVHDTHFLLKGMFRTIEWKYGDGRPSAGQKHFGVGLRMNGGDWRACWLVEDACAWLLDEWALPKSAALHAMELDAKWQAAIPGGAEKPPGVATRARAMLFTETELALQEKLNEALPF
jgi:hypothetical protein